MPTKSAEGKSLGDRILEMRKKKKIDLERLAELTGYDADFLKKLEEGKISPPVGTLIQISKALAVESSAFLAEDRRKERQKTYRKRTKSYSYKTLNPGSWDKHLWVYTVTLEPKKEHERIEFKHEGEEFILVMEGKVEVKVGPEVETLRKGQNIHFDSSKPHELKNLSTDKTKLLVVVYTP